MTALEILNFLYFRPFKGSFKVTLSEIIEVTIRVYD